MKINPMVKKPIWIIPIALMVSILLMAAGCAWPYGRIKSNPEVTRMFETNTVPEEYHYFYDGRSNQPYVIIGLFPEYRLASRFWEPLAPNTQDFGRKVRGIYYNQLGEASYNPGGSFILNAAGDPVGIWYSRYRQTGVIVKEDKSVFIYSPGDEIYAADPPKMDRRH